MVLLNEYFRFKEENAFSKSSTTMRYFDNAWSSSCNSSRFYYYYYYYYVILVTILAQFMLANYSIDP